MKQEQIELALTEGLPFAITMADGSTHVVTDRRQIAFGKTYIWLVTNDDLAHILPLITMTGITYLTPAAEKKTV